MSGFIISTGDNELSQTLAPLLQNRLIYTAEWGWLIRDNAVYAEVDQAVATKIVSDLLVAEGTRLKLLRTQDDKPIVPFGEVKRLSSHDKARGVSTLLKAHLGEKGARFDDDQYVLNCPNGVVNLRTSDLREHQPSDRFRKVTSVPYFPDVDMTEWLRALEAMEPEVRDWMQLRLGGALFGTQGPDALVPFLKGGGHNGKTICISSVAGALGNYAVLVSPTMLDSQAVGSAEYYFADLLGARLAYIEELPSIYLNENALKRLSGSADITARAIRMSPITFKSTANLFITTNHSIRVTSNDEGILRRIVEVPFPFHYTTAPVKDNDRIMDMSMKSFMASAAGRTQVLAWLVEGARRAWSESEAYMTPPASISEATATWKDGADSVKAWADTNIAFDEGVVTPWPVLVGSYGSFALDSGSAALGEYKLREALQNLVYGEVIAATDWRSKRRIRDEKAGIVSQKWCVVGLRLITSSELAAPTAPAHTHTPIENFNFSSGVQDRAGAPGAPLQSGGPDV